MTILLYALAFVGAVLALYFLVCFVIYLRYAWADRKFRLGIVKTDRYKELRARYESEGHRGEKAHDLAMRRIHRKAVRITTQRARR